VDGRSGERTYLLARWVSEARGAGPDDELMESLLPVTLRVAGTAESESKEIA